MGRKIEIQTPRWALPLLKPCRYKGAKGGRGSGKSHFFAEYLVESLVLDPDLQAVGIREIQKSLKFSAKKLIEAKIQALGVGDLFEVLESEIRRKGGKGIIIFQGMQDHTAESIKSLEGFKIAWVEEAQSLSKRSLELLLPTIREEGSEIWFSWNPDDPDDPVDELMVGEYDTTGPVIYGQDSITVHVNYQDNPFLPDTLRQEMERHRVRRPDTFGHVWLGEYTSISDAQILNGKWRVAEFEPQASWDGPYHGADWGFSNDPTTLLKVWTHDDCLFVEREAYKVALELDDVGGHWKRQVPGCEQHVIRADNARPESISHVRKAQPDPMPHIEACQKWPGSVEDGIEHLRNYREIIIHPRCEHTQEEARKYKYKVNKNTGDPLPQIVDAHNHCWDAIRYALGPLIKTPKRKRAGALRGTR